MIQCFVNPNFDISFVNNIYPKLLSASKIDASYSVHPRMLHKHSNQLEILLVRSGNGVYIIDEKRYPIKKGDIVICNCGILHDEDPAKSQELYTYSCAFTNVHINGLPENCLISSTAYPVLRSNELYETLEPLVAMIYSLLASDIENIDETCNYLSISLISLLIQISRKNEEDESYGSKRPVDILSLRIKQYIDTHYDESLTLQSIGDALNINPYYLAHIFKDNTGYSPIQYIMRRRIGESQSLLITTNHPITRIADMVGYGNPCHFNVLFSKYVGMSPSNYRKSYTKMKNKK